MKIYVEKGQSLETTLDCPLHGTMRVTLTRTDQGLVVDGIRCPFLHRFAGLDFVRIQDGPVIVLEKEERNDRANPTRETP